MPQRESITCSVRVTCDAASQVCVAGGMYMYIRAMRDLKPCADMCFGCFGCERCLYGGRRKFCAREGNPS